MAAGRATFVKSPDGQEMLAVNLLLDRKDKRPSIDLETAMGHTALTWASHCGKPEVVDTLIDHGAELMVQLLLQRGAPMEYNDSFMNDAASLIQTAFQHHYWLQHRPKWTKTRSREYRERQLNHMFGLSIRCNRFGKRRRRLCCSSLPR